MQNQYNFTSKFLNTVVPNALNLCFIFQAELLSLTEVLSFVNKKLKDNKLATLNSHWKQNVAKKSWTLDFG